MYFIEPCVVFLFLARSQSKLILYTPRLIMLMMNELSVRLRSQCMHNINLLLLNYSETKRKQKRSRLQVLFYNIRVARTCFYHFK
jgi:hypothetical protein